MAQSDFSTASVQAGRLRHRVTIQNFVTQTLPSGQETENWADGATVWAEVKGVSGRELLTAGAELAESTIRVWMRYRRDVTAASRLHVINDTHPGPKINPAGNNV